MNSAREFVEGFDLSRFEGVGEHVQKAPMVPPKMIEQISLVMHNAVSFVFQRCWGEVDINEDDIERLGQRFWDEEIFGELLPDISEMDKWIESFRLLYGEYTVQYKVCDGMLFERWAEQEIISSITGDDPAGVNALTAVSHKKDELVVRSSESGVEGVEAKVIQVAKGVFTDFFPMYANMATFPNFIQYICTQLDNLLVLSPAAEHVDVEVHIGGQWKLYEKLFLHYSEELKKFFAAAGIEITGDFTTKDEITSVYTQYYLKRISPGSLQSNML